MENKYNTPNLSVVPAPEAQKPAEPAAVISEVPEELQATPAPDLRVVPDVTDSAPTTAEAAPAEEDGSKDAIEIARQIAEQGRAAGLEVESPYDEQGNLKRIGQAGLSSSQAGLQALKNRVGGPKNL